MRANRSGREGGVGGALWTARNDHYRRTARARARAWAGVDRRVIRRVNYAEVMARRGSLPLFVPPFVPGLEVSGTVRALGAGVDGLRVGDAVCALTTRGGYAEVALAPAAMTYSLTGRADSDMKAGAVMPTIVPTAHALVHEVARLRVGEDVLIHAASGGVGTLLGQIARRTGAGAVFGVVSTPEKADFASTPPGAIAPGDHIEAEFVGLGGVSVSFGR